MTYPDFNNPFYLDHALRLCFSYRHWTGKPLILWQHQTGNLVQTLFDAPFVLVSHGIEEIPVFNFGTRRALALFELGWEQFIQ